MEEAGADIRYCCRVSAASLLLELQRPQREHYSSELKLRSP